MAICPEELGVSPHPTPLPCSLHTFGIIWSGGETEAQGGDVSGYKARWPAPFPGFSTGGCSPTPLGPRWLAP